MNAHKAVVLTLLVLGYCTLNVAAYRRELKEEVRRLRGAVRRWRRWKGELPWRLAWRKWRLRKAAIPSGGNSLDPIDEPLFAMVLKGYGDTAEPDAEERAVLAAAERLSDGAAELCRSGPRTATVTRRTGRRSLPRSKNAREASASASASAAGAGARAAGARTWTGSRRMAPGRRSCSPPRTSTTSQRIATRPTCARSARAATTPTTPLIARRHGR